MKVLGGTSQSNIGFTHVLFMQSYQLIHTIKSPVTKLKLEKQLSGFSQVLSYEPHAGFYSYEIQTGIRKNELIKSLGKFIQSLQLGKEERVVLYDPRLQSEIFELPNNKEKILLNGDIEKEKRVERIVLMIFKHIRMKIEIEEVQKEYFDSLTNNTQLR